ncbi:MAG TPA: tetratricopeptide repeat protein [Verrucomicrobiae bacterium]|nr:tetratricopeptide repeat protein [Verrucomicrobiae bacterium]
MYCRAARGGLLAAILMAGCARQSGQAVPQRIAILRFENFSGDSSVDWQGRAISEVLITELSGIRLARLYAFYRAQGPRPVSAPGISTETPLALAAGATQIGYGEYTVRNHRLEARFTIEDERTLKTVKVVEASAPAGDVIGAATALARQITPNPAAPGVRNSEALMLFIKANEASDATAMQQGMAQAIAADPEYLQSYHNLAQIKAQSGDRAGAQAVILQALALKNLPEIERVRFELESAEYEGDAGARQAALLKLARLDPSDGGIWRALADLAMSRHDYAQAMQACQKAVALAPDDIEMLNLLGYAAAQAGELETGMAALRRYQALRSNDANPLDSMGDLNLLNGKLAEAESFYLQANQKDHTFLSDGDLLKAAMARLLAGEPTAASKLAEQYFEARTASKDPGVELKRAEWMWLTGQRSQAASRMEAGAASAEKAGWRDGASQAWAEASVLRLMLGDQKAAAENVQRAMSPVTPASLGTALVARFLAMPAASPAEWSARAAQQFPQPGLAAVKNLALVYALLVSRDFAAAETALRQMRESGTPAPDGLEVLLAWACLETGKANDAAALLKANPIPPRTGFTIYTAFYMPRLFYLRGRLSEKEGRRDDARAQYQKFIDLSGPGALVWGEEAKARAAL